MINIWTDKRTTIVAYINNNTVYLMGYKYI